MKPIRKEIFITVGILILIIGGITLWPKNQSHNDEQQAHKDIYYCPMHTFYTSDKPGLCQICHMTLVKRELAPAPDLSNTAEESDRGKKKERTILYWTDTMIPGYKASGPGKSPMGMDLTPVYENEQNSALEKSTKGHATISLAYSKQQLIGVKTEKISSRPLTKTIRAVGTVAHDMVLYQTQAEFLQANVDLKKAEAGGLQEAIEQSQFLVDSNL